MANRYYIGPAGGAWNNNANWDAISGGPGPASFPVAGDNAFLDAASPGGPTLTAAAACDQLDCTGFVGAFDLAGFTLTIHTTLFRLVVGMTFTHNNGLVDFVAAAGTVLITTAGKTLGGVRFGNVATGATYQLQDPLTTALDFDFVRGIFDANNQNAVVGQDLYWRATLLTDTFRLGSSTFEVQRNFRTELSNVMNTATAYGTSTFKFTGDSVWTDNGPRSWNCYILDLAYPGKTVSYTPSTTGTVGTSAVRQIRVNGGTWNVANASHSFTVSPSLAAITDPLYFAVGSTMAVAAFGFWYATGGTVVADLPAFNNNGQVGLGGTSGTNITYRMNGDVVMGNLRAEQQFAAGFMRLLMNGFNLTVNGNVYHANQGMAIEVSTGILAVTGNFTMGNIASTYFYLRVATGGQANIAGNLTLGVAGDTRTPKVEVVGTGRISVGGNWDSSLVAAPVFTAVSTGAVRFTAAGPFIIACAPNEAWPTVEITGGGSTTLPNGFNCYDLLITAGLITAGATLTVRNNLVNGGTFTSGGSVTVGSSFVNTGTLILAGSNIRCTGSICSVSGVNPASLSMAATCLRLQLLTGMNITTFVIEDRPTPGIVQFLAGGTYNIGTMNSQVASTDGTVELVSSVAGTRYNFNVTVATSLKNLWPRDNNAVTPLTGDLTNKDLGNNNGWTLNSPGYISVSTDDPGTDLLVMGGVNKMQYCWFVADSLVNLTAQAAAFATGSNNWHRKTNIPFAMLDNLQLYSTYFIAVGMIDDRGNRLAPNVGAGDYTTATATHRSDSLATQRHHLHVDRVEAFGA